MAQGRATLAAVEPPAPETIRPTQAFLDLVRHGLVLARFHGVAVSAGQLAHDFCRQRGPA